MYFSCLMNLQLDQVLNFTDKICQVVVRIEKEKYYFSRHAATGLAA